MEPERLPFTDYKSYVEWRAEWRGVNVALVAEIRETKKICRDHASVLRNDKYGTSDQAKAQSRLSSLKRQATAHYLVRRQSKVQSRELRALQPGLDHASRIGRVPTEASQPRG